MSMTSGDAKKKFLTLEQIWDALREIAALSAEQGIPVALVGGVALQLYGSDRLTKDIDVIADTPLAGAPIRQLGVGGLAMALPSGGEADVIVRADDYTALYREALAKAVSMQDVPIPVVPVEYIAAMKMAAARKKDEIDLEFLLRNDIIDRAATRRIIARFLGIYAAREFDAIAAEVDWKREAGIE
jgi:hypothetical protein